MVIYCYSRVKSRYLEQSKEQMVRFLLGACNCTEQRWGFVPNESKMECFNGEVFVGSLQLMRAKWSFYGERKKAENKRKKGEES
ncbi:hypothetical protein L6452_40738 [Arctium lappa]|uniref:Uncharacterized protein n=1 Tax=Arctium lappa TaxID=4217 RepID=A0ACB8XMR3_ARCLA|nr:hypothetical protein L6452_40738 [Arctium lappa]